MGLRYEYYLQHHWDSVGRIHPVCEGILHGVAVKELYLKQEDLGSNPHHHHDEYSNTLPKAVLIVHLNHFLGMTSQC